MASQTKRRHDSILCLGLAALMMVLSFASPASVLRAQTAGSGSGAAVPPTGDPAAGATTGGEEANAVGRRVSQPAAHGHDGSQLAGLADEGFTHEQIRRIQNLEVETMCACPRENWSRTLSNCPDACADRQKRQIRIYVSEGDDDATVLKRMKSEYGGRVLASPSGGGVATLLYSMPIILVVLAVSISGAVIALWLRSSRSSGSLVPTTDHTYSDAELDRVATELEELD